MNSMVAFLTDILTFKAISEADSCSCNAQLVQSLLVTATVLGKPTKCHCQCQQLSLYPIIFSISYKEILFGTKKRSL